MDKIRDDNHRASNLVNSDGTNKWLAHPKDKSGKLELVLQLEEACILSYMDIGTTWCSSLEVRVGRSDWPQSMEFKSLVPSVVLMSPVDCRLGRATNCTKMFSRADFSKEIASQQWDRLQIICRQPFRRDVQTGISFIRIKSVEAEKAVSPGNKNNSEIDSHAARLQKHFLGNGSAGVEGPAEALKLRLMKMSGSSDNGCEHEQALSRTAKIVLKAAEKSGTYRPFTASPNRKSEFFSESIAKKNDIPIQEDIKSFLPTLKISPENIDIITIADLRHKFEKRKRRKLTIDEKRIFSEMCQTYICDLLDRNSEVCDVDALETNTDIPHSNVKGTPDTRSFNMASRAAPLKRAMNPSSLSNPLTVRHSERGAGIISVTQAEVKENSRDNSCLSKDIQEVKNKTKSFCSSPKATPGKINHSGDKQSTPGNKSILKDLSPPDSLCNSNTDLNGRTFADSENSKNPRVSQNRKRKLHHHPIRFCDDRQDNQDVSVEVEATTQVVSLHSQSRSYDDNTGKIEKNYNNSDPGNISIIETNGKSQVKQTFLSLKSGNVSIDKHSSKPSSAKDANRLKHQNSAVGDIKSKRKPRGKRRKLNHSSLNLLQQFSSDLFSDDESTSESVSERQNITFPVKAGNTPDSSKDVQSVGSHRRHSIVGTNDEQGKPDIAATKLSNEPYPSSLNSSLQKTPKFTFRKSSNAMKSEKSSHPSDQKSAVSPRGSNRHQSNFLSAESTNISECDKCHGLFPRVELAVHRAFCTPSGGVSGQGSHHDEMIIDESVEYAECPICLQRFPQDVLLVHASDCGL